jgi:hypothetical protein
LKPSRVSSRDGGGYAEELSGRDQRRPDFKLTAGLRFGDELDAPVLELAGLGVFLEGHAHRGILRVLVFVVEGLLLVDNRVLKKVLILAAALALAACSVDYGQTRSSFQLKVAGKTLEEAKEAAGKPAREEPRGADEVVLIYSGMNSIPQYSSCPLFASFLKVTSTAASLAFMFSLSKVFFSYTSTVSPVERVSWRTGFPAVAIASSRVLPETLSWNELRVWP